MSNDSQGATAPLPSQSGRFITLDGIEGVGKSSATQFICDYLKNKQFDFCLTREPGGTPVGESIREILLHNKDFSMETDTECLLMFAARAEHLLKVVQPALASGRWVVCDRFVDATYAYQGGGRGMDMNRIAALEDWLTGITTPHKTFILDAPVEVGLGRAKSRSTPDRIESEADAFFERVRQVYLDRARANPERYVVVDSSVDDWPRVEAQLQTALDAWFEEWVTIA